MKRLREVLDFVSDCPSIKIVSENGTILCSIPEEGSIDDMVFPDSEVVTIHYIGENNFCSIIIKDKSELTLGSIMDYFYDNAIILNKYLDEIGMITKENIIRGDGKDGNLAEEPVYDIRAVGNKVYVVVRG